MARNDPLVTWSTHRRPFSETLHRHVKVYTAMPDSGGRGDFAVGS
jgi:hypothetical protein